MTREGERVVGVPLEEFLQDVALGVEHPGGGPEEAVVDVAAVEAALAEAVVEEERVVGLLGEVEPAEREDDVGVRVVEVEEVGRDAAAGVGVGPAAEDAGQVDAVAAGPGRREEERRGGGEVGLVVGHDEAAHARHGLKVGGGGEAPGGAVDLAAVEAALPCPARAREAVDALEQRQAAGQRHGRGTRWRRRQSVIHRPPRWRRQVVAGRELRRTIGARRGSSREPKIRVRMVYDECSNQREGDGDPTNDSIRDFFPFFFVLVCDEGGRRCRRSHEWCGGVMTGCVDNRSFGAGDRTRCLLHLHLHFYKLCSTKRHFHLPNIV